MSDRGRYSEAGDTLVEVLLALIVLGLASVALLIAFSTSISASAEHRTLATDNTVLATATQVTIANIQSQPSLFSCPSSLSSYPGYGPSGITLPAPYAGNYTVLYAASNSVEWWNSTSKTFTSTCVANAPELITIYLQGTTVTNSFVVDYPIGTSNALTAGAAAQLVFLQQPVGGYAGSPFTTQPIVEIVTAGGSPSTVTTDLSPVILTLTQGSGALSGCTGDEILGVVTFKGCTIGTGGSNFEITATDGSLTPATSNPFSVSSSGYHLVFTSQPVAGASGAGFTTSPVVTVENSLNVPDVTWAGTITLTLSGGALSALPSQTCAFTTATTITLTPLLGIATLPSGCAFSGGYYYDASRSPPQTATEYTMAATANPTAPTDAAVPASSNTFAVTSFGAPSQIAFITQPTGVASATATTPFTGQPVVAVEDAYGNVVTSASNTIALAINSGAQGITLSNCNVPTPNSAGQYIFSGCEGSNYGTQLTLTASSSGLTSATSTKFSITGLATQLLFTTQPVAGDSGSQLAIEPVLTVEDASNRVVTSSTTPIAFNAVVPSSGTMTSCTNLVPQAGVISVANCAFAGLVGTPYTIVATQGSLTSAPSNSFTPTGPGPASQLVFATSPVAGVSGTIFTTQPIVDVEDSAGNIVTSSNAFISLTASGGTLAGCSGLTASAGVVTVSNCTFAGVVLTPYTLTAASGPLTSAPSASFSPTYAGVPSQIVLTGCSSAIVTATSCTVAASIEDVYGNIETHDNASVMVFSKASGGGTLTGLSSPTVFNGGASDTVTGAAQGLVGIVASADSLTSSPLSVTVNAPTTTALSSSVNPSVVGQTVTYTATVSVTSPDTGPPSGNIEFLDNGTAIGVCGGASGATVNGAGQATCLTSWLNVGPQSITAQYLGNAGAYYLASTSSTVSQTVNQAATNTSVTSSTNPALVGQPVTLSATVTTTSPGSGVPTGNIEFLDNGAAIGVCGGASGVAVNGSGLATCLTSWPAVGTHSITTQYLGSSNYLASTSTALSQGVTITGTTTALTSSGPNPSTVGQTITYTATVSVTAPGTGTPSSADTVTFKDGATTISCGSGSVAFNGTTATCTVTYLSITGSPHSITAVFGGDANYATSTSSAYVQTVNHALTTTVVTSTPNPSVPNQTVTYTATVAVTSPGAGTPSAADTLVFKDGVSTITCGGGSVAFNGTTATCTVTYASPTGSPHSITAVFGGDANYVTSTSAAYIQTVNKASTTTVVTSTPNPSVPAQTVTYTATVSVTSPGTGTPLAADTLVFKDGASTITCGGGSVAFNGTTATCTVTYANLTGSPHSITATFGGDTNYATSTSAAYIQTVNPAATTTALVSGTNPTTAGQTVTYTATVSTTPPGTGTATGKVEFLDNGTAIASCGGAAGVTVNGSAVATCAEAMNTSGSRTITATYLGAALFATSTSSNLTETVNPATPLLTLALSTTTIATGGTAHGLATLSGESGTAAGTVAYSYYTNSACTATPVAVSTATVTTGTVPNSSNVTFNTGGMFYWQAVYSGDTSDAAATSGCVALTVNNTVTKAVAGSYTLTVPANVTSFTFTMAAAGGGGGRNGAKGGTGGTVSGTITIPSSSNPTTFTVIVGGGGAVGGNGAAGAGGTSGIGCALGGNGGGGTDAGGGGGGSTCIYLVGAPAGTVIAVGGGGGGGGNGTGTGGIGDGGLTTNPGTSTGGAGTASGGNAGTSGTTQTTGTPQYGITNTAGKLGGLGASAGTCSAGVCGAGGAGTTGGGTGNPSAGGGGGGGGMASGGGGTDAGTGANDNGGGGGGGSAYTGGTATISVAVSSATDGGGGAGGNAAGTAGSVSFTGAGLTLA